jgi:pimeloyl-ACP methyl ester carboxylesterase
MVSQEGFVNVDGARLYYEVIGTGHPLILIHGFTLDTRVWDYQFHHFSSWYRVIRYDVRGYGKSSLPQGERYSRSDDLKSIMKHLEVSSAHILGLSMGGQIAIDFVLEYPTMVNSLILADAAIEGYQWKEFGRAFNNTVEISMKSGVEAGKEYFSSLEIFKPAAEKPEVAMKLMKMLTDYSGWHFINDDPYIQLDPPAIDRLGEISDPTLVVMGELDTADFHEIGRLFIEGIPNSSKVVLPSVGHISNLEAPENFNEVVSDFLDNA